MAKRLPLRRPRACPPNTRFSTLLRSYHSSSTSSQPKSEQFTPEESRILRASMLHVPAHGFTAQSLTLGATDAGFRPVSTSLFPDRAYALVRWHLWEQRRALSAHESEQRVGTGGLEELSSRTDGAGRPSGGAGHHREQKLDEDAVRRNIRRLLWTRLRGNEAVISRWPEALAILAQPSYVPFAIQSLASLADDICFLAGDTSVDPSWYTKRAGIAGIYAATAYGYPPSPGKNALSRPRDALKGWRSQIFESNPNLTLNYILRYMIFFKADFMRTELFMTQDSSPAFIATENFLDRRLHEARVLRQGARDVAQWAGFTGMAVLNVLRSKGVRI